MNIGLGEAIGIWLSGQKLDGMSVWGLSVIWWSRIAKVALYLAGLNVVLEIIGSTRLRASGEYLREHRGLVLGIASFAYPFLAGILSNELYDLFSLTATEILVSTVALVVGALVLAAIGPKLAPLLFDGVARALETGYVVQIGRIVSLFLVTLGVFVDLLTS